MNYFIVLFKNKKKKRIINKYVTKDKALVAYNKLIKKSDNIFFEKKIQNAEECNFELGLISSKRESDLPTYTKDYMGRSKRVYIDNDSNLSFIEIKPYNLEEKIFDINQNKKISLFEFEKNYLSINGFKVISILNHKIVLQNEDKFNLFSLKDENEALRFLDSLTNYLSHINNLSCMILKSTTNNQKKYMYDLLANYGFDKSILYRRVTTQPLRK